MTQVTFLGGPRDGETMDWQGYSVWVPNLMMATLRGYAHPPVKLSDLLPSPDHRYEARQDDDGRWWYLYLGT